MRSRGLAVALVLAVLLLASVPGPLGGALASSNGPSVHPNVLGSTSGARAAGASPAPFAPPASSGAGTFFTTSSVPAVPASQQSCVAAVCVTASDDPSLNLTSQGDLVAAYTAWTTEAPCAAARPYALTEVGVVVSTNLGTSWSSPTYLGNPVCTAPEVSEFPSAWEPSLTSLANGTLVLTYVEYNVSAVGGFPPSLSFLAGSPSVTYDQLVVTRSFNAGTTWTTPLVLNTSANPTLGSPSYPPVRPVVTASGDMVYLAWMNLTAQLNGFGTGSSAIHVVASTDGGASFGAPVTLATLGSAGTSVAMNPSIAVDPSGRLYVAYTTNLTYLAVVGCPTSGCYYGGWDSTVMVASSTDNGTTFNETALPGNALVPPSRWGPFFDPSPVLAIGPGGTQVYVAYSSGYLTPLCSIYGCYTGLGAELSVANSSNDGASFSPARVVDPNLLGGTQDGANLLYNPAIGVTSDGILQITVTYDNFSVCAAGAYGTFCGPQAEIYVNSTDNGTSFSQPIYVSDNSTQLYLNPNNPDGEYASLVTAGRSVWLAYTSDICPAWNTTLVYSACPWPGTGGASGIQISELYRGAGVTLTFSETGLATGTVWNVDVLGNLRQGTAPSTLVISGVPTGDSLTWNLSVAAPYGYRYAPTSSLANPAALTAATTVTITFAPQVLFDLTTVPFLAPYPYGTPGCGYGAGFFWNLSACPTVNWNITPGPGPEWVTPGSVVPLSVTPNDVFYCNYIYGCYQTDILNLTFLSWKGTGSSAANTTSLFTNVTVNGPVNETASFTFNGWCTYQWTPVFYACLGPNDSYGFHETGLPSGTNWAVTIGGGGQVQTNESTTPWNLFQSTLNASLLNYTVWTVPSSRNGYLYVPTATPVSPIVPETDPIIDVNFTLEAVGLATFPVVVTAAGLPAGTSWNYAVDSTQFGTALATAPAVDVAGGTHSISAGPVVTSNESRYSPTSIDTLVLSGTGIRTNFTSAIASVAVQGSTYATVNYSLQYWLEDTATTCGTVTASSDWYSIGATVRLVATPDTNCTFVGWTGRGAGSVTSTDTVIVPVIGGPITELAAFEPVAPPTFTLKVVESGLGAGTPLTVGVGDQLYSGLSEITITGLSAGVYPVSLPYVYANGSDGTRYLPAINSTSLTNVSQGYLLDADGWLNLSYATQYLVNVSASSGGTVSPSGLGWYASGDQFSLTATPSAGELFLGWAGAGPGALSGATATLPFVVTGAATEVATFGPTPTVAPEIFPVTVAETGLPSGTPWNAEIGTVGVGSATGTVAASLVNGTYEVVLPVVSAGPGIRYVPSPSVTNVTVDGAAADASVAYSAQYYVTLSSSMGGSINASTGWWPAGTVLDVVATPSNASEVFVNWTGVGTGAYTGPSPTLHLTVDAPISEAASFGPAVTSVVTTPGTSSGSSSGLYIGLGLLVGLLVVGIGVGAVALRRRPPSPPETPGPLYDAGPEEPPEVPET